MKLVQAVENRVNCLILQMQQERVQYCGWWRRSKLTLEAEWVAELVWTFWGGRGTIYEIEASAGLTLKVGSSGLLNRVRAGPRHVGAPARLIMWHPFKPITYSLNICCLGLGWGTFLRARAQISDNFQRNYITCGNLSLLAPYLRLL